MAHWIYKVNLNVKYKETRNRSSKPDMPIDESLTEWLQRYVVPGYGRKRKHFYFEYKEHGVVNNFHRAYF
jgi:hypothetical protein